MPKRTAEQQDRSVEVLQALAHQLRLQICILLNEGSLSVSNICERLDSPQHRVSQQLALLRSAGVVSAEKQSRQVFYSIKDPQAQEMINVIIKANKSANNSASHQPASDQAGEPSVGKPVAGKSVSGKRSGPSFEAGRFSEII